MIRILKSIRIALRGIKVVDLVKDDKMNLSGIDEQSLISKGLAKEWDDVETAVEKALTDPEFSFDFASTITDKKELDEYAEAHGFKLDRRMTPDKMITALAEQVAAQ